jgi:hypothetical protein
MDASLVLKQDQAKVLHIVSNTYRKHNPTSALHISTIFNCHGPPDGCFGGLVHISTKTAFVNGCKLSFEARPSQSTYNCLTYI